MAAKIFFLLALITVVASTDDCNCEIPTELENSALWKFFKKLSADLNENDPTDKNLAAVLPGELSPLLDCNCLEKNRRKRRIMPESAEEAKEIIEASKSEEQNDLEGLRSPKCPHGYVWYRIICVSEELVMEK